ncbi:MAG: methyltransferase domain-containing protein [Candidatus Dormiibacterota bacterium]
MSLGDAPSPSAASGLPAEELESVYERRFNTADSNRKDGVWAEIVLHLQRYIPVNSCVLDLACDRGAFIRHVVARERWASDLRDVRASLPEEVHFVQSSGLALASELPNKYFDVVFMSNYLEHLLSRSEVVNQLGVAHRLLRKGGRVIVLQPNIRLVGGGYWDFIDHHVALTERSLAEAASLAGFEAERIITRFLPYSTLGRLPQSRGLVRAYLRFRPAWLALGKQTLYIGRA